MQAKDEKWIKGLTPGMHVASAARHVLGVRLQAVEARLGPALHQSDDDPEHVHQLRVSTRRAAIAVRIFGDCLPKKICEKINQLLKTLRRAAGQVRDWDVFLESSIPHKARPSAQLRPGLDFLQGFVQGQRAAAQVQLIEQTCNSESKLLRVRKSTLRALDSALRDGGVITLARSMLRRLLDDLVAAAGQDLHDYEHLHRVRILGKRLRYAMEVFACCFPKPFRDKIYVSVEEMQEILGFANDSHVASNHLEALRTRLSKTQPGEWKRLRPGVEKLLHFHRRRLVEQRQAFEKWWAAWHGSATESLLRKYVKARR